MKSATQLLIEYCDKRIKETKEIKKNHYRNIKKLILNGTLKK